MDLGATVVADEQPLEVVQPGEGALNDPAHAPEPGAVSCLAVGDEGSDAPFADEAAVRVVVVAAIGDEVRVRVTGPCARCIMTTLPQSDLPKDSGILRAAAQHNQANVGVYADVIAGRTIRRGDSVTIV